MNFKFYSILRGNSWLSKTFFFAIVCMGMVAGANAQTGTVSGKVINPAGLAVIGASVQVKGTQVGTFTDASGNFTINAAADATLVISSVGYTTQELPLAGKTTVTIALQAANTALEQVVVIGYGTQRKRDVTGSITQIKGEELAKMPNTNPVSSLQGKVAGLTIVNSGRAGSSPTVRIRGVNSTANASPLYVVDGVFQTNIDYLNQADIESIEVLRDPSSLAIFGLQGGNGVIVVTTKRAAKGTTRITLQSNIGIQTVQNKIDVVDATGFRQLYDAQLANLNAAPFDYSKFNGNTNWQDIILQNALLNNNTITVSSTGEKTTTLFSLGYNTQEGVLKNDKYQKYIARFNNELRVTKNIKIGGDVTGFHFISNPPTASLNNALWAAPIVPVKYASDVYYAMPSFQQAQVGNPQATIDQNDRTSINKGYRIVGSVFAEAKFLQNFTWRSSFYTDLGFNNSRNYTPIPFKYFFAGENGGNDTVKVNNPNARTSVGQSQSEFRKFQQDHTLSWNKKINSHNIMALGGFTTLFQGNSSLSGSRIDTGLIIPNNPNLWYLGTVNENNPLNNGGAGGEEAFQSMFARVNYSFQNKYLVNLSYRRDGSSKFAPANRWGDFGSAGLGWILSDENFFKVKNLDFLKLRGAWGTTGSGLGLGPNLYLAGLNTGTVAVFGNNIYGSVRPAYIPSPDLHWEVVRGLDLGLETRAFNNRLNFDFTWYNRKTKDILTTVSVLSAVGQTSVLTNLGTISNKGIEIAAGWSDKIGEHFTYSVSANYSYNKNNVESIGDNFNFEILGNGGTNKTVTGSSIGYFFGYNQIGIYQSLADMDDMATFVSSRPGDIAFEDVDGDGVITDKDRKNLGTPFPLHNFGFNVSLGYKGFDLLVEGQGVAGNKIYTQRRNATFATLNYESNRLNAWTQPGTSNIEPILDNTRGNNFLFSSYFLEPGDYLRLRTLQLGYTFSNKILGANSPVKQLRVYLSGQNLATFSKATGYTPEVSLSNPIASGIDNGTYPVPAVYSFGVNVTF